MVVANTLHLFFYMTMLLVLAGAWATPAPAGGATYLPPDADHCEIFRVLSQDLPRECASKVQLMTGQRTRSIRFHEAGQASAGSTTAAILSTAPSVGQDVTTQPASETVAGTTMETMVEQPLEVDADQHELSLAMQIQFEHDSARLTGSARASLDMIARVLNDALMVDQVIMIEGHADASGSYDYNMQLSQRRAKAVRAYLVSEHEIQDWRLPVVGKGEGALYDETAPNSSVNRRVEFVNITG